MGLSVARTKLFIYLASGTLAGIAAVVYTARLGSAQNITGIGWEPDAIAAAVIGGTLLTGGFGYVLGSVVGARVLGLMHVLITRDGRRPPEATTRIRGGTRLTGGFGYVLGSVVGALVLGLMNVLITRDGSIPPEATTIITGGILLIFVLLQRAVISRQRE